MIKFIMGQKDITEVIFRCEISIKNIILHYSGILFFITVYLFLYFIDIFTITFVLFLLLLNILIDSLSLPLLLRYLKIKDKIIFTRNKIIVNDQKEYLIQYIDFFVLGKPIANIGELTFAKFNYIKIVFLNGDYVILTSLMYDKNLELILKAYPNINIVRNKCTFCFFDTQKNDW